MKRFFAGLAATLLLTTSHATVLTYQFSGSLDSFYEYDFANWTIGYPGAISLPTGDYAVGQTFHGRFTYDTASVRQPAGWNPDRTEYRGDSATSSVELVFDVSGNTFKTSGSHPNPVLGINNDYGLADWFDLDYVTESHSDGSRQRGVRFDFRDWDMAAVQPGNAIPSSLALFDSAGVVFSLGSGFDPSLIYVGLGSLTSWQRIEASATVPEPGTGALILGSLALLALQRKRKRG